ncbi:MAG: hypothetical protein LV479_09815 [Methylacidiphilales bacterium]|nr:hypothetical protein [Candidatus Methylacidiphilales bacterium]
MRHAAWVLGYHGCDETTGESILRGQDEIRVSTNRFDWLGEGAYFWENSYSRALHWANFLKDTPGSSKSRIKRPFVIGAIIDPGNCLDLTQYESLEILKGAYAPCQESFRLAKMKMPKNEPGDPTDVDLVKRKLDCAVINYLHSMRAREKQPSFDTVRAPFMEGGFLFEGSKLHSMTHLQWCVRNPKISILGYFRPR